MTTRNPQKLGMNADSPERLEVPAPLMTPVMLLKCLDIKLMVKWKDMSCFLCERLNKGKRIILNYTQEAHHIEVTVHIPDQQTVLKEIKCQSWNKTV